MCKCVNCPECQGTGTVWISFGGQYLGKHRCDDLDDSETCDYCGGSGIVEICDDCQEALEMEVKG